MGGMLKVEGLMCGVPAFNLQPIRLLIYRQNISMFVYRSEAGAYGVLHKRRQVVKIQFQHYARTVSFNCATRKAENLARLLIGVPVGEQR